MRASRVCAIGVVASVTGCSLFVSLDDLSGGGDADSGVIDAAKEDAPLALDAGDAGDAEPALTYAQTVSNDSPIAYYRLDDTGKNAADFTSHHLDGTYGPFAAQGSPSLLTSDPDLAANFAANSDGGKNVGIGVPRAVLLEPRTVTVEAWVRTTTLTNEQIVSYGPQAASPFQPYVLQIGSSGPIYDAQFFGAGLGFLLGTTALAIGSTYYLAGTFDGTQLRVYVNGEVDGILAATGSQIQNYDGVTGLGIGSGAIGDFPFSGIIDEVAIYDYALTGAQILAHYQAGNAK